jgi:hypothetical protein
MFRSLHIKDAFRLVAATWPIAVLRALVLIFLWLVAAAYVTLVASALLALTRVSPWYGVPALLLGMCGLAMLLSLAQRRVLTPLKGITLAVMAERLAGRPVPSGPAQIRWGHRRLCERLGNSVAMARLDDRVSGAVSGFTDQVYTLAPSMPLARFRAFRPVTRWFVRQSVGYVDDAVLARSFWTSGNVRVDARDSVVLYATNFRKLLTLAVAWMFLSYVPALLLVGAAVSPLAILGSGIAVGGGVWSLVDALVLTWISKTAIGDSLGVAAATVSYHKATVNARPDAELADCLECMPSFSAVQTDPVKGKASPVREGVPLYAERTLSRTV